MSLFDRPVITGKRVDQDRAERAKVLDRMPTRAQLQQEVFTELLDMFRRMEDTNTELIAQLRGGIHNSVLGVEVATFNTQGVIERAYAVPMGSVFVANHGSGTVTVTSDAASQVPLAGKGMGLVAAGTAQTINIASTTLTLYGIAGEEVSLQVFAKPQPPQASGGNAGGSVRPGLPYDTLGTAAVGTAGSAVIPAVVGRTAFVTGFEITWNSLGVGTVTDTATLAPTATSFGSQQYLLTTIAGAGGQLVVAFPDPIGATGPNTAIALAVTGLADRAAVVINLHGFYL